MQNVSQAWQEAQTQRILPQALASVTIDNLDETAQNSARAPSGYPAELSDNSHLLDTTIPDNAPAAGLTQYWLLDGGTNLLRDYPTSSKRLINEALEYVSLPGIEEDNGSAMINFSSTQTNEIPGLLIVWSTAFNEYAVDYTIKVRLGGTAIYTLTVTGNSNIMTYHTLPSIANYDNILINVSTWSIPNAYTKIERVMVGYRVSFDNKDIMELTHTQYLDRFSIALPQSTLRWSMYNRNDQWNPSNPQGLFGLLANRLPVKAKLGYRLSGNDEMLDEGTFYLSGWDTPQNGITATFEAKNFLELMRQTFDTQNVYASDGTIASAGSPYYDSNGNPIQFNGGTGCLEYLVKQALYQCGCYKLVAYLDMGALDVYPILLPKDFTYTCAEVLQLCLNAAGGFMWQSRSGMVGIYGNEESPALSPQPIRTTITTAISYKYAEYNLQRACRQVVVNQGESYEGKYPATPTEDGEVQLISNPLVQDATWASDIAQWVYRWLSCRNVVSGYYRADPKIDIYDYIKVENKYGENELCLDELTYSFNGTIKGKYKGKAIQWQT